MIDDTSLVERCLKDDREAFEKLLSRYKVRIYSFIYHMVQNQSDAEDLAQETFLKAFRNLHSYNHDSPFLSWVFGIAHHSVIDFTRARRPEVLSLDDEDNRIDLQDAKDTPAHFAETSTQKEWIERLFSAIPPRYREVLVLRHREGLGYREMAEILRIPEGTVKIRLFRGRALLKTKLEALGRLD